MTTYAYVSDRLPDFCQFGQAGTCHIYKGSTSISASSSQNERFQEIAKGDTSPDARRLRNPS